MITQTIADATTTWIAVGSCATGVGALITATLAFVTKKVASETQQLATETKRLAGATEEDVSASWRPVLICPDGLRAPPNYQARPPSLVESVPWTVVRDYGALRLRLMNVGRGPALSLQMTVESEAYQERRVTAMTSFGTTVPPGRMIEAWLPGHLLRDPPGRALVYKVIVQYADLQGRVFQSEMRFADPTPGLRHESEWTATPVTFVFDNPTGTAVLAFTDDPEGERPEPLPPNSQDAPRVTVTMPEAGSAGAPPTQPLLQG
jgi:hypothetical protein